MIKRAEYGYDKKADNAKYKHRQAEFVRRIADDTLFECAVRLMTAFIVAPASETTLACGAEDAPTANHGNCADYCVAN